MHTGNKDDHTEQEDLEKELPEVIVADWAFEKGDSKDETNKTQAGDSPR
ncbi:hypothetical protein [Halobacterium wangiae]|nr:hypothetical protein [Halobacterium wangiae]